MDLEYFTGSQRHPSDYRLLVVTQGPLAKSINRGVRTTCSDVISRSPGRARQRCNLVRETNRNTIVKVQDIPNARAGWLQKAIADG